jgi:hypothetical protein
MYVLIAPRKTTQNQKSTTMPQSSRVGSRCWAANGKYGISRKYTRFPAITAIRDWTKFSMPGLDTAELEKQHSAFSTQHSAKTQGLAKQVRKVRVIRGVFCLG